MKKVSWYYFIAILLMSLLLVACSDKDGENEVESNTDSLEQEKDEDVEISEEVTEEEPEEPEDSEEESEELSFEVNTPAPEDQGEMDVWLEGEININGTDVIVKGRTNLLPDSRITLRTNPEEGFIFGGGMKSTKVEANGDFVIEDGIPSDLKGLTHFELKFELDEQSDEIQQHYGEGLSGKFVNWNADAEEASKKLSFKKTVTIGEDEITIPIESTEWKIPEDSGNTAVRIEPEIEREGEYLVVKISSNLLGDTFIRGDADIPNYITTGFFGETYTNPDGSAILYIEDPAKDSRIKNLEDYEIVITMDPSRSDNGPHVKETYGANGENLSGDYVKQEDDGKIIEQRITVTVQ